MIYTEDAARLVEAACNFLRALRMRAEGETYGEDCDKEVTAATVAAFAREMVAQSRAIDGPDGYGLDMLAIVRPELAGRIVGIRSAIERMMKAMGRTDRDDYLPAVIAIREACLTLAAEVEAARESRGETAGEMAG